MLCQLTGTTNRRPPSDTHRKSAQTLQPSEQLYRSKGMQNDATGYSLHTLCMCALAPGANAHSRLTGIEYTWYDPVTCSSTIIAASAMTPRGWSRLNSMFSDTVLPYAQYPAVDCSECNVGMAQTSAAAEAIRRACEPAHLAVLTLLHLRMRRQHSTS